MHDKCRARYIGREREREKNGEIKKKELISSVKHGQLIKALITKMMKRQQ